MPRFLVNPGQIEDARRRNKTIQRTVLTPTHDLWIQISRVTTILI